MSAAAAEFKNEPVKRLQWKRALKTPNLLHTRLWFVRSLWPTPLRSRRISHLLRRRSSTRPAETVGRSLGFVFRKSRNAEPIRPRAPLAFLQAAGQSRRESLPLVALARRRTGNTRLFPRRKNVDCLQEQSPGGPPLLGCCAQTDTLFTLGSLGHAASERKRKGEANEALSSTAPAAAGGVCLAESLKPLSNRRPPRLQSFVCFGQRAQGFSQIRCEGRGGRSELTSFQTLA